MQMSMTVGTVQIPSTVFHLPLKKIKLQCWTSQNLWRCGLRGALYVIMNMTCVVVTLGNKDLTMKEFHISNNIKRAMVNLDSDPEYAKTFLIVALQTLHERKPVGV